ncbi:MAG: hypothetical protein U5K74_11070 [Gemmatimonadaceae bacterium]|nr:hypothetical protein [Gemmatimonadaceae bacterium]
MAKEPSRTYTDPSISTSGPVAPTPKPKGKGKWKITAVLFLGAVLPLAAFSPRLIDRDQFWFRYADGERAGFVQKLSNKGWICKTWEGELALANGPNVMPEIFKFTVRDDKVAESINNSLGKQVKLTYSQHKGVPTQCFGETEYFVNAIQVVGGPPPAAGGTIAPVPAPTVVPGTTPAPTVP